jgi:hypothetical protein
MPPETGRRKSIAGGFRGIFAVRPARETSAESRALPSEDDDGVMKTRTLMLLALVTGLAILAAGAIQILMATK